MKAILQTHDNVQDGMNEGLKVTLNERTLDKLVNVDSHDKFAEDYQYDFIMNDVRKYVVNGSNKYLSNTTCEKIWQWVQQEKVKWFSVLLA